MYNSQFNQDKWVNEILRGKEYGTFIDIGGCRPIKTNNTYFFENEKEWAGIIVEANPKVIMELDRKRKAKTLHAAIWDEPSIPIEFLALDTHYSLSTAILDNKDEHSEKRKSDFQTKYTVETTTISKIIDNFFFDTDGHIDYISLDVEGAEYKAICGFDQSRHSASCITVEHNNNQGLRVNIHDRLKDNYRRLTDVERLVYFEYGNEQHQRWFWNEDWYVNKDLKK